MQETLKPCPFCGNPKPYLDKCSCTVLCKNCYCKSPLVGKLLTKEERDSVKDWEAAVMAWNKRA